MNSIIEAQIELEEQQFQEMLRCSYSMKYFYENYWRVNDNLNIADLDMNSIPVRIINSVGEDTNIKEVTQLKGRGHTAIYGIKYEK